MTKSSESIYTVGMNNKKITPKDRRDIVNEVESGKFQKDIAVDFGISEAYVSKIVKESKQQTRPPVKNLESVPIENLLNRLQEINSEINETHSEKSDRRDVANRLQGKIMDDNKTLLATDDAELKRITQVSITATQRIIVWNEDHTSLDVGLIDLYATQLAIFREIVRRGHGIPTKIILP